MGKATQPRSATEGTHAQVAEELCRCVDDGVWHKRIIEVFSAAPEFIEWGHDLVMLAHEGGEDRDLTRVVGSHRWGEQVCVYQLAEALEELAEAMAVRPVRSRSARADISP